MSNFMRLRKTQNRRRGQVKIGKMRSLWFVRAIFLKSDEPKMIDPKEHPSYAACCQLAGWPPPLF